MKKLMNKKGFTLMEMLIVVAIIVILVAVSIPTFTSSLDDAKKATDDANLRAAKAVANTMDMTDGWAALFTGAENAEAMDGELYFDMDAGEFVSGTTNADKGQSDAYDDQYIIITIENGKMKTGPVWGTPAS